VIWANGFADAFTKRVALHRCAFSVVTVLSSTSPVLAHSFLVDANPSSKDHVAPAPKTVKLRFGGGVEPNYSKLTIEDANGKILSDGAHEVPGKPEELSLEAPDLAPGRYIVGYRALSQCGHIVEGNCEFTVDAKYAVRAEAQ
jgi:copper resistance protein C